MKRKIVYILILLIAFTLRFYKIDVIPHGFNADEAAIGYNAWSLIKTGMDEHKQSWPLVFRSFDDYKPPLYFYMTLPWVAMLGLSELSVRLSNILLGSITVVFLGLFVDNLFKKSKPGVFVSLCLAIMPWHIVFSRGGWEVNAATSLLILGLWILSLKNEIKYLFVGGVLMLLAMYTYHSARIYIPLIGLSYVLIFNTSVIYPKNIKKLIIPVILWLVILTPLLGQMFSKEGQSRFSGVSIFFDQGPLWEALELRREHQGQGIYTRLLHSKYITYTLRFTKNYLSHFSVDFLAIKGDVIDRNKVSGVGQIYLLMVPLFFIGAYTTLNIHKKVFLFFLLFLLVSPIASSLTFQSPHALRSEVMTVPIAVLTGLGVYGATRNKRFGGVILGCILLLGTFEVARFWHYYEKHYHVDYPTAWQFGFSKIGKYLKDNENKYEKVIISTRYDQPYILTAFYLQYSPKKLQDELVMTNRDNFGFSTGSKFGKYEFKKITSEDFTSKGSLIVVADEGKEGGTLLEEIKIGGKTIYKLYETK